VRQPGIAESSAARATLARSAGVLEARKPDGENTRRVARPAVDHHSGGAAVARAHGHELSPRCIGLRRTGADLHFARLQIVESRHSYRRYVAITSGSTRRVMRPVTRSSSCRDYREDQALTSSRSTVGNWRIVRISNGGRRKHGPSMVKSCGRQCCRSGRRGRPCARRCANAPSDPDASPTIMTGRF
jgi:hypothetical protein